MNLKIKEIDEEPLDMKVGLYLLKDRNILKFVFDTAPAPSYPGEYIEPCLLETTIPNARAFLKQADVEDELSGPPVGMSEDFVLRLVAMAQDPSLAQDLIKGKVDA